MNQAAIATLWSALLLLRRALKAAARPVGYCILQVPLDDKTPRIYLDEEPAVPAEREIAVALSSELPAHAASGRAVFGFVSGFALAPQKTGPLDADEVSFLSLYLPYCLLPFHGKRLGRAIAVAHFAQTLDGKIATQSGHSKWIGNPENVVHAHRMRALCDAILIGRGTLERDAPALTVRHVEGENPTRVVLCSTDTDFGSLLSSLNDEILVFGTADDHAGQIPTLASPGGQEQGAEASRRVRYQVMPRKDGHMDTHEILRALYREGQESVYIEGGAATTSTFLADGALDIVQLHFAPMIMGSGISSFTLPTIEEVGASIGFDHFAFHPVGDSVMFTGEVAKAKRP